MFSFRDWPELFGLNPEHSASGVDVVVTDSHLGDDSSWLRIPSSMMSPVVDAIRRLVD